MRIISGSARGRRIQAPRGDKTRPTRDRVRQSVFDTLGQRFDGLVVLDLFAGSGALGLEALSRGARACVFVEKAPEAIAAIQANLNSLALSARAEVRRGDALILASLRGPFDLVFADPPYALGAGAVLAALAAAPAGLLREGAEVVLEHDRREELPERLGDLARRDQRIYGETGVSFYGVHHPAKGA